MQCVLQNNKRYETSLFLWVGNSTTEIKMLSALSNSFWFRIKLINTDTIIYKKNFGNNFLIAFNV